MTALIRFPYYVAFQLLARTCLRAPALTFRHGRVKGWLASIRSNQRRWVAARLRHLSPIYFQVALPREETTT
jgi:hypothetical protein